MSKYITTTGYCSTTGKPMGVQLRVEQEGYAAVGAFALSASGCKTAQSAEFTGKLYPDGFRCKHCGNSGIIQCDACGVLFCVKDKAETVTCPHCGKSFSLTWVSDIDQLSDSHIKSSKQ